jgi:membrane protease YdiL (CAAX protease family)
MKPEARQMRFINRYSLITGLVLMFVLTWPLYSALGLFVGYGLAAAALTVTGLGTGRGGVLSLLRRFLICRVGLRWYLVVLILPTVLYLAAIALHHLLGGPRIDLSATQARSIFGDRATMWLFVIPFFLVDAITNGEELAWRGFVLPRLQRRYGALVSSVILGAIWGLWHLPRLWSTSDPLSIVYAILHDIALAVLFTWVYNSTRGSLLIVTLFHAAFNAAYVFLPVSPTATGVPSIQLAALATEYLAAICVVFAAGARSLSRFPRIQEGVHAPLALHAYPSSRAGPSSSQT